MQVFIGTDHDHRKAALVLAHSLRARSSGPISITLLEQHQLERAGLYWRPRDPLQSTDFSFSRFLVPALLGFRGWGLYLDGDMMCLDDPFKLWCLRDNQFALQCVQHPDHPWGDKKMNGKPQTAYPRKNWSSLMLFNASRCVNLSINYVNQASGLQLHCFEWLSEDSLLGALPRRWNHIVNLDPLPLPEASPGIVHWTLGGPWLKASVDDDDHLSLLWLQEMRQVRELMS
jgi:lipopolysaccharide biosynthesis glycosyltransferase